jgi:hypothetical protein
MDDLIKIEKNLDHFSSGAINELKSVVLEHASDIVDEAGRLEASQRRDDQPAEVTAALVSKARDLIELRNTQPSQPTIGWLPRVIATASPILTGVFASLLDMTTTVGLLTVLLSGAIALVSNTFIVTKGG